MNPQDVSWVDVITPIITFALVIALPTALAVWVIYKTLTEKPGAAEDEAAATGSEDAE